MRQKPGTRRSASEKIVKDIQRATRKQYSAEEKIRIVLDGLRGVSDVNACGADFRFSIRGVVARIGCQVLTQAFATTTDMLNAA